MRPRLLAAAPLAILASFGACAPDDPPPLPDAGPGERCEVDSSYAPESALPLAVGEQATGHLCPAFDKDYYRFTTSQPGSVVSVRLWMDTHLTPAEPSWTLLDADGSPTGVSARHPNRSAGEPVDFTTSLRVAEAGEYTLFIQDAEGFEDRFDIVNPYHLQVEVTPEPDANEPNNERQSATPLVAGEAATGLIATTGDEDWFALPVEQDAQIVDATLRVPADSGLELVLEVRAADGLTVVSEREAAPDGDVWSARVRVGAAGEAGTRYYLVVSDQSGQNAQLDPAVGTYELVATVLDDEDPQEAGGRNDTVPTATVVTAPATLTGSLASTNDVDMFRLSPPAGTSTNNPRVLLITLSASTGVPSDVQPQVLVLGHDPERSNGQLAACPCSQEIDPNNPLPLEPPQECLPLSDGERCGEIRMQRVLSESGTVRLGFPLRNTRPVIVSVNDLGDDGFQESGEYTLTLDVVDDTDPGEQGDDYLIPTFQYPSYDNRSELQAQVRRSKPNARDISQPFLPLCSELEVPDAGPVDDDGGLPEEPSEPCMQEADVPDPGPGQVGSYVVCDGQDWTTQGSGRITYQGDRDWFRIDVPSAGYWALDFDYSVDRVSPVELTFFVHTEESLISAFLDATQTGNGCESSLDCDAGSVCIDSKCWEDRDDNPSFSGHVFPSADQCSFLHVNDDRPLYVEITDNGINDFDLDMTYSFQLRVRCGCPESCNGGFNSCQGVPPPP